jgi:hypothetical protein
VVQRITLRRSATLVGAATAFILIASVALFSALAPRVGTLHSIVFASVAAAMLVLAALGDARNRPRALKIGPDGLSAWNAASKLLVRGQIVGCAQWSDRLLVVALAGENGHRRSLVIAADMLPADLFRQLSVDARRAVHA